MNSKNPEMHDCECGFLWRHGQSGDHSCGPYYRHTIAELRAAAAPQVVADEKTAPNGAPQPIIGKLMDEISALPVLWGLNEPGALLRNSDVFRVLAVAGREQAALAAAPAQAQEPRKPTDISQRLREYAGNSGYSHNDYADTMRVAADECERFYGGMVAWKENAQQKDRTIIDLRAKLAEAAQVQAQEPVALLTLGGIDGGEYGDNDLELVSSKAVEKLQEQLVRGQNPVVLELYAYSAPVQPVAVPDGWCQFIDGVKTQNVARDTEELGTIKSIFKVMAPAGAQAEYRPFYFAAPAAQGDAETLQKVRDAVEQFKVEWMRVPYFAHRVNKAVRDQIGTATSIVVNIPCIIDAAIAAKAAS